MFVNNSLNLSRADLAKLRSVDIYKPHKVKKVFSPLVARVFGVRQEYLERCANFDAWLDNVLLETTNLQLLYTDITNVRAPITQRLIKNLVITKTGFFRHRAQHAVFVASLKRVFEARIAACDKSPVRIYVPGCSSGDEAYTIAMIIRKAGYHKLGIPMEIIATDLSREQIDIAREGSYHDLVASESLDTGSYELIDDYGQYFHRDPRCLDYQVVAEVKAMVTLGLENLVCPTVEGKFDLIACHHVLEHLSQEAVRFISDRLLTSLRPGGYIVSNDNSFRANNSLEMLQPQRSRVGYAAFALR